MVLVEETAEVGFAVTGVDGSYFFSYWMVLSGGSDCPLPCGVIGLGAGCCAGGA